MEDDSELNRLKNENLRLKRWVFDISRFIDRFNAAVRTVCNEEQGIAIEKKLEELEQAQRGEDEEAEQMWERHQISKIEWKWADSE